MRKNFLLGWLMLSALGLVGCAPTVAQTPKPKNPYAAAIAACGTPLEAEKKAGGMSLNSSRCNLAREKVFIKGGEVTPGDIVQFCIAGYNGIGKDVSGSKVRVGLPPSNSVEAIDIYGPDGNQGTWLNYKGVDTYLPYQEQVALPDALGAGETFFVCQAVKIK